MAENTYPLTDKEKATLEALQARADQVLADMGALTLQYELTKAAMIHSATQHDQAFKTLASKILARNEIDAENPALKYMFDAEGENLMVAMPEEQPSEPQAIG